MSSNVPNESRIEIPDIQKVVIFGAGTMGSAIAAHLANLGLSVTMVAPTIAEAESGLERCRRISPPAFYDVKNSAEIQLLALEECESAVREADWVCEAIFENFEAKTLLFEKLEPWLSDRAFITTNTSGLEISKLASGRSTHFKQKFLGTHFFNPPRYLKLVELIPSQWTDYQELLSMKHFLEQIAGRRCVLAKDSPGFIANRYGMWLMFQAIHLAEKLGMGIEEVDAITGDFIGRPKSASFRLNDVVGLDVMQDIASNLLARCSDDPFINELRTPASMKVLLEKGWLGAKTGQGYYRKEGKELLAFDFGTLAYRNLREPEFTTHIELAKLPIGERIREAMQRRDECGTFLRDHMTATLKYAEFLKETVSHSVQDFDRIMEWGFGWEMGPFKLIDAIGSENLGLEPRQYYQGNEMLGFRGNWVKKLDESEFRSIHQFQIIDQKSKLTIRDLGNGISALSTTSKMGVIDPELMEQLHEVLDKGLDSFVFTSEAKSFSAGFDLNSFQECIVNSDYDSVENYLVSLQTLGEKLAKRKAVAAIYGHSLGGGFELALSCPIVVAQAESKIGFPEARVGLLPGGRGTVMTRMNRQDSVKDLVDAAILLASGKISENAVEAKEWGFLRHTDRIEYHADRLIHTAKSLLLEKDFAGALPHSWKIIEGPLTGMIDREVAARKSSGDFTTYDAFIGDKIKQVFSKPHSYETALIRERQEFVELCKNNLTQTRIRHMLENGRPLRN